MCLLAKVNNPSDKLIEYCYGMSDKCQQRCLHDKRTGHIAAMNWAKVVQVLNQFNSYPSVKQ